MNSRVEEPLIFRVFLGNQKGSRKCRKRSFAKKRKKENEIRWAYHILQRSKRERERERERERVSEVAKGDFGEFDFEELVWC